MSPLAQASTSDLWSFLLEAPRLTLPLQPLCIPHALGTWGPPSLETHALHPWGSVLCFLFDKSPLLFLSS